MILGLAVWTTAMLAHVAATAFAVARLSRAGTSRDAQFFATCLSFTASLSLILHTLALTIGLSLASGVVAIALWDVAHVAALWRRRPERPAGLTIPELGALIALVAVVVVWMVRAAGSIDVVGPDAAHYHVPYAMNFAHGASPFDLLATPHLYPMAASVVTAWFILPVGTPLLADLATVLPFLVLIASINLLFRCATGLSGLAWATWLGIGLWLTPIFQMVSLGSADLWFTAACVAIVALLVQGWASRSLRGLDMALLGGAAGLLVGSKATGVPALALIVLAFGVTFVVRALLPPGSKDPGLRRRENVRNGTPGRENGAPGPNGAPGL